MSSLTLDAEALYRELLRGVRSLCLPGSRLVGITSGGAWLAERLQRELQLLPDWYIAQHRGVHVLDAGGGELVEQLALHVGAGQLVVLLLDLAADQPAQLLQALGRRRSALEAHARHLGLCQHRQVAPMQVRRDVGLRGTEALAALVRDLVDADAFLRGAKSCLVSKGRR